MLDAGKALTAVRTEDLVALLRGVHRGELACPITPKGLATVGELHLLDAVSFLQGLDKEATRAVLVAVIAERKARGR